MTRSVLSNRFFCVTCEIGLTTFVEVEEHLNLGHRLHEVRVTVWEREK